MPSRNYKSTYTLLSGYHSRYIFAYNKVVKTEEVSNLKAFMFAVDANKINVLFLINITYILKQKCLLCMIIIIIIIFIIWNITIMS